VLREAARRLIHCIREGDQVARFGGDEFVVLVQQSGAQAEVEPIISRIHAVLGKPIALPDGEVTLSVSIGAVEASPEFHSPEDLLAAADRAMYASKRLNA
jgi:diguanylate cyclase (GGDEF)-like protein